MSKEPWKTGEKKLRRNFDKTLESIWERWDELEIEGGPFGDLNQINQTGLESVEIDQLYFEVGWARGVSEALGWSLKRPGPREWSPRDR